jgi:hypothetical protein
VAATARTPSTAVPADAIADDTTNADASSGVFLYFNMTLGKAQLVHSTDLAGNNGVETVLATFDGLTDLGALSASNVEFI